MPWKESSVMDERMRFVIRLKDGESMASLCREFGISRKTGYKIFERYEECGLEGLTDQFKADRLVLVTQRALETSRLKREVKALKQLSPSTLVGKSSSMNQLRQTVEKIAPTNS